jgi:hypothetical protein
MSTTMNVGEIERFLSWLHPSTDGVYEIRAMQMPSQPNQSGFFRQPAAAAAAAYHLSQHHPPGVYVTINEVSAAKASGQVLNRVGAAQRGGSAADCDISRLACLMVDIDSTRKSGTSATDDELAQAQSLADHLEFEMFWHHGWPDPTFCMSGNGFYLLWRIDLANTPDNVGLLKRVLAGLAGRCTEFEGAEVDQSTYNPSRLIKVVGTMARKGPADDPERPHRLSHVIEYGSDQVVTAAQLQAVAAPEPQPAQAGNGNGKGRSIWDLPGMQSSFDLATWLQQHQVPVGPPEPYQGGSKWLFSSLPPMCHSHPGGHQDVAAFVIERPDGTLQAGCRHDRCTWGWHDLRSYYEPGRHRQGLPLPDLPHGLWQSHTVCDDTPAAPPAKWVFKPVPVNQLTGNGGQMHPEVIKGVLREREVMNVIAAPKVGKSWLVYSLAEAVATGGRWLGHECTPGKVLLIDNELHQGTIETRMRRLCAPDALGDIDVISLRGQSIDIFQLANGLSEQVQPGDYKIIILDCLYRSIPMGMSENDNSDMTHLFNQLTQLAERAAVAMISVHHTSKGDQSQKAATDVGSGAGVLSRAPDTHLVLRQHQLTDHIVLDISCRSFPPHDSMTLRRDITGDDGGQNGVIEWCDCPDIEPELFSPGKARGLDENGKAGWERVIDQLAGVFPDGMTKVQLGAALGVTVDTIGTYIKRIYDNGLGANITKEGKGASRAVWRYSDD